MKQYDIFISYRREGGENPAKQLCDKLKEHGYRVFLDVECLKGGSFNKQLYKVIDKCKDFLLVLPPHGLDRCNNEGDWVKLEIEHAQEKGKNIIPIMIDGFVFPKELPENLDFLRYQEGLEPVARLYDDSVKDLEKRLLKSKPVIMYHRLATRYLCWFICFIAIIGLIIGITDYRRFISSKTTAIPTTSVLDGKVPNDQAPEMMSDSLTTDQYKEGASVLGSDIPRSSVQSITFRDSLIGANRQSWDVSAEQNGSVIAWMEDNNLIIAGEGGVRAPKDASFLFAGYKNAFSINFNGCYSTTGATDMRYMFYGCERLTDLDVLWFDTEDVQNMRAMFANCRALTKLNVSNFQTLKVTDMSFMFWKCKQLTKIDVSGFDTRRVMDMNNMFSWCTNLEALDVASFDTRAVTDMSSMFKCCKQLAELDVSMFNTWNVTNMKSMFEECGKLERLDVSGFNTMKVTDMSWMFSGCKQLEVLDVSGFVTENVTSFRQMFYECRRLDALDVSGFNTEHATNLALMFSACEKLKHLDVSGFETSNVTTMYSMFNTCCNLETIDASGFDTGNVSDMSFMFYRCESLKALDISGFVTGNVRKMIYMFTGCTQLRSLDLSMFETSMVEDMSYMFADCCSLEEILVGDRFIIAHARHEDIIRDCSANITKNGQVLPVSMLYDT